MKAVICGTVRALCDARDAHAWDDHLQMPFVRDIELHDGELPVSHDEITHYVDDGQVWRVTDDDVDFHGKLFEVIAEWPDADQGPWSGPDMRPFRVFLATVSIKKQTDEMVWALAAAGCTHVYRMWRQRETMIDGANGEPTIYAELAVLGK